MESAVRGRLRRRHGWTLVDALVSMTFLGLLALILHNFTTVALHALQVRQVADDLDETAQIALEIMARDIRDVGYGMPATGDRGLRAAGSAQIGVARDLDLDGETSSSNERVSYLLHRESGQLRRQLGNASAQPMVDGLETDQVLFRYFDASGAELVAADGDLDSGQRALVRRVDITLRLAANQPAAGSAAPITVEHRMSVTLRNGQI